MTMNNVPWLVFIVFKAFEIAWLCKFLFWRFVCQLAITEVQQADVMSDMVMTSHARINDQRIGFGVGLSTTDNIEYIHNLREKYMENKHYDSLDVDTTLPGGESWLNVIDNFVIVLTRLLVNSVLSMGSGRLHQNLIIKRTILLYLSQYLSF